MQTDKQESNSKIVKLTQKQEQFIGIFPTYI